MANEVGDFYRQFLTKTHKRMFRNGSKRTSGSRKKRESKPTTGSMPWAVAVDKKAGRY